MGLLLSLRYGHVILVSGYPVLTDPCMCNTILKASHWLESERFQPKFLGHILGKRIFVAMGLRLRVELRNDDLWAEGQ